MEYAGRLHRFAAFIIDAIVISVVIVVLNAVGIINLGDPSTTDQVLEAAISFGYYILLTAAFGATLGKMALGMTVVDESGQKAGFFKVLIRRPSGSSSPPSSFSWASSGYCSTATVRAGTTRSEERSW